MKVENELAMDKHFLKISPLMWHIWVLRDCYELYLPEDFYTKEILSQWHKDIYARIFIAAWLTIVKNGEQIFIYKKRLSTL